MRGCGVVKINDLFTESRKVYEVVLDPAINFELRYSGARPLIKNYYGFLDITLSTI